jgi:hypothetical protein
MDMLELIQRGNDHVVVNDDHQSLKAAAATLLDSFDEWSAFTVVAASPAGERLLGAAMMLYPTLRGGRSARTVIVDINVASGTLIANAARRLREETVVEQVVAIALHSLVAHDFRWSIEGVDSVLIPSAQAPDSRQFGQRRKHGLVLTSAD